MTSANDYPERDPLDWRLLGSANAGKTWEVDVFAGDNTGLVIAEVELRDEHEHIALPTWAGAEVTGQAPYYNSALAVHPFNGWPLEKKAALGS